MSRKVVLDQKHMFVLFHPRRVCVCVAAYIWMLLCVCGMFEGRRQEEEKSCLCVCRNVF